MKTTEAYDLNPIIKVMEQAMSDLNRLTMIPDETLVRVKLINHTTPPFRLKKVEKRKYDFMAIINFPGIYVEPPAFWRVKWINHETHDICITIDFTDFQYYYCPEEAGIIETTT